MSLAVYSIVTEAGMYALRERRQHVTQEDFELAVSKVGGHDRADCLLLSLTQSLVHRS